MNTMHWGLQQGMLGVRQQTLKPSLTSVGPNRYLTQQDFIYMLGLALLLHAAVAGIASLFPHEQVTDIPVRALSFKIGDADRTQIFAPRMAVQAPVAPPPAPAPEVKPAPPPKPAPVAKPVAAQASPWRANTTAPRVTQPTAKPAPLAPLAPTPTPAPTPAPTPQPALAKLPDPALLSQPAVAPNPQRFVRENTTAAASATETPTDNGTQAAQEARARYEQIISAWIQKHKIYPSAANGAKGRVVVRFEIDRSGNMRNYAIEQSAGNAALDAAALDMVLRANPMPAVPADYPAGSLIGFSIGLNFDPSQ